MKLARYARLVIAYCILVILWGAFVRASGSGAGCGSHWPLCNGEILPESPQWKTLVEFGHRVTSGLSLLAIAALAWFAFRAPHRRRLRQAAIASVVFILLEAAIGAGLVLLDLVELDRSLLRVISISLHLINTSLLMAALTITAHAASDAAHSIPSRDTLLPADPAQRKIVVAFGLSFLLLGATGAIAALGDTLFRHGTLAEGLAADFSATSHWLLPLRTFHPPIAVLWGALFIAWAGQFRTHPALRRPFWTMTGLIATNFSLGLLNIGLLAPVGLQLAHLLIANLIWVTGVEWALRFGEETSLNPQ
jgi:cytochrome c oxidase assembly protein subunit 15/protoheme IX farnesyltransferase